MIQGTVGAAGSPAYVEVVVDVGDEAAEALTNFLWEQGAVGVVEEALLAGPARLRAFFPLTASTTSGEALAVRVDAYLAGLRALGLAAGPRARVAPLADADWASAWREHFRPVAVGRALLIAPPWETPAAGDRLVLTIEPGRAFGTGHHGTTAGCLELLESLVAAERPARALDLGTGSGILAIAAARLGVAEVLACDSDPDAVAAAGANAALNGVAGRVRAVLDDVATLAAAPAPLVLANLLAAAHRALGARYAALVAAGGVLVAGGLLDAEADDVAGALAAHGFRREAARSLEGWTSLALRHAPLHASA
ncbi:MAG TPA: 50S ribosomal protein L11 methyltransferase [Candidatus Binatia bacterium]|nr:50S ribosomal protein L11 methyltransferase [Candidatus Binatia bacterium]